MNHQNFDSVFQKIGGIDALHDIVDRFYDKVMADDSVNGFFEGANMDMQRGKMKAFLMMALGGPARFTGKDMRTAHARLVTAGLGDAHYDTVIGYLVESLKEHGVAQDIISEIGTVAESVRNDVLNR